MHKQMYFIHMVPFNICMVISSLTHAYTNKCRGGFRGGSDEPPSAPKTTHNLYVLIWLGQAMIFGQQNPSLTKILASRVVLKGAFTHLGKI